VHLVTRGHFWSRDKNGSHTFDPSQLEPPWYANFMAPSFIEPELWAIEVLLCGNRDFRLLCACDLDIDPMTYIYEPDPYSLEVHPGVQI